MLIERCVTVNVEAAHRDASGNLHGHSYLIECWTDEDIDLAAFHAGMIETSRTVDHSLLEHTIGGASMEALGMWFIKHAPLFLARKLTRVTVIRPTLGFKVEVRGP